MFKNLSIGLKLSLMLVASISVLLLAGTVGLSNYLGSKLEERSVRTLEDTNATVITMIDVFNRSLMLSTVRMAKLFASEYPEGFEYRDGRLYHGEIPVVEHDTRTPDRFTTVSEAFGTVLTRVGNDFVRTVTSLKDGQGQRVAGTLLGTAHPATLALLRGEALTHKITMSGRELMMHYVPLKDASGAVIGALSAGIDYTPGLAALGRSILSVRVGSSGYPFAISAGGDNRGTVMIHPEIQGQSVLSTTDAEGRPFIAEMLERKNGFLTYTWKNPGEDKAREKVAEFNYYEPWDWLVISGSYLDEFNSESRQVGQGMILLFLVLVPIVTLIIVVATRRWVSKPLNEAVALATRVADADLSVQVRASSQDEVGKLMAALGRMVGGLGKTIAEVRDAATTVSDDANVLRRQADEVAVNSDKQSDATAGMAAAVEQMSTSIDLIAANTDEARETSAEAAQISADSSRIIRLATEAMQDIAGTVGQASEKLSQLGQSSKEISSIVNTIHEIAEQTNLLALNAAIEAARAGEQGRGFAVVADEVRKLAERTSSSTKEISRMVDHIQHDTDDAVASMNKGVEQVDSGVRLATEADQAIRRLYDGAMKTSEAVVSISNAAKEQSAAAASVAQGVEQIAQMAERNNADARQSAEASKALEEIASRLRRSVEHFRV
ncbi:methyl-accepting chemotaxis protein [Thauera sp. Sel9]|uniref:methyl-accepting chemotaxis protein n=1 Tax=Thauera sp. Sel9 TaxID=2974299 RepID=UPI0021E181F6|nr:methyl-accepting chemotaxis protein [Thauera sp. Sel9]MCV2216963.1 methyl-accepting chemotaxis protein [Thauera sp. Sel9]